MCVIQAVRLINFKIRFYSHIERLYGFSQMQNAKKCDVKVALVDLVYNCYRLVSGNVMLNRLILINRINSKSWFIVIADYCSMKNCGSGQFV